MSNVISAFPNWGRELLSSSQIDRNFRAEFLQPKRVLIIFRSFAKNALFAPRFWLRDDVILPLIRLIWFLACAKIADRDKE